MKLPPVDYHIHTVYCGHAEHDMTVANIVKKAEDIGLTSMAITDHVYLKEDLPHLDWIKKDLQNVRFNLELFLGVEIEMDCTSQDGRAQTEIPKVDFVIGGTHVFPGTDIGWYKKVNFSKKEKLRIYRAWFKWMKNVIKRGEVNILAHPGMLIAQNSIIEKFSGNVLADFEELFSLAKVKGVGIELNEACASKLTAEEKETYPQVVQIAMEKGLIISLGSDAHSLERIGKKDWCQEVADRLNFEDARLFRPERRER
jgi:HisJ family histidinol phosphate phosphatase